MSVVSRSAVLLLILTLLLAACTRERPAPEFLPTLDDSTAPDSSPSEADRVTEEPDPSQAETDNGADARFGLDLDDPLGQGEEPEVEILDTTPTPEDSDETFTYTVRPGDTLTGLALRFETDIATLRRLNALDSDALAVGQPLIIPYIEGMTAEGAPTPTPGPHYYTVQAGDTLSGIATRFNANPVELAEANNLLDPNNLVVGSQLMIPGYAPPAETGNGAGTQPESAAAGDTEARFVHIVQPGEGLMEIASRYGIDLNTIATANNLVNRNVLRVGQELVIPGITARDAAIRSGAVHIVQSGESLLGIALRYGVTVEAVMEFNNISNPDNISVGQQLIIPRN